jgi:hypothetical protein
MKPIPGGGTFFIVAPTEHAGLPSQRTKSELRLESKFLSR